MVSLMLATVAGQAQTVRVKKTEQRIKGENAVGYSAALEAPANEVTTALQRYLKPFGKPRQQEEILVLAETSINGKAYTKPLYAVVRGSASSSTAWIGVNVKEWGADSASVTSQLESMVKNFGVSFYREKIQAQIDEAQQAADAVEKQQQRTVNELRSIEQRIENNKKEHQQLKRMIQNNRLDSVTLMVKKQQNLRSKDSLIMVSEKVKHALELQKERQRKVN